MKSRVFLKRIRKNIPLGSMDAEIKARFKKFSADVLKPPKKKRKTRKWHSESADPAKALGPSDILDRIPVTDIHYILF